MKKLFIGCLLLVSCHNAKVPSSVIEASDSTIELADNSRLESLATEMYGDRYGLDANHDNSFSIVKSKFKNIQDLLPNISFFVYDHHMEKIILSDTLMSGYIGWEDDFTVKIISRVSSESDGNSLNKVSKLFNVQTHELTIEP